MTVMIQIRNVPDALHRRLKSRAALAGMSLSDYLLGEIRHVAERPTVDELRARLEQRAATTLSVALAQAVRAETRSPMIIADAPAEGVDRPLADWIPRCQRAVRLSPARDPYIAARDAPADKTRP